MKLFNDLRAAVTNLDTCDAAAAELGYDAADDDEADDSAAADAAETVESGGN